MRKMNAQFLVGYPLKSRSLMPLMWGWKGGHNAHARGHMGATRRGSYETAKAATTATGSEARPSQASPSAAAAGGDGASPMRAPRWSTMLRTTLHLRPTKRRKS